MLLTLLLSLSLAVIATLPAQEPVKAQSGWLAGWQFRKSHVINPASGAGSGYQIRIVTYGGRGVDSGESVYLNGWCRRDFADVRFTASDGVTLLSYWMEEYVEGSYAVFWVKINDDLSSSPTTIYVYYGNYEAASAADGESTFLFFDEFSGTSLNLTKWSVHYDEDGSSSVSVSDGCLVIYQNDNDYTGGGTYLTSYFNCTDTNTALEFKMRVVVNYWRDTSLGPAYVSDSYYTALFIRTYYTRWEYRIVSSRGDSGYVNTGWGASSGTWYRGSIRRNTATSTTFVIGSSSTTNTAYPAQMVANVRIGGGGYFNGYSYYDFIFLRKYVNPEPSHGSWGQQEARLKRLDWLEGWGYRKSHVINNATGAGANYTVQIRVNYGSGIDTGDNVYLNGKCRTDFDDIRFTKSDGITLLGYWIEEKSTSNYAYIWVKLTVDVSNSPVTIYIYYGNQLATSASYGDDTFLLFDDFLGSSLNTAKWTVVTNQGTLQVTSGYLRMALPSGGKVIDVASVASFSGGLSIEYRQYLVPASPGYYYSSVYYGPNNNNYSSIGYATWSGYESALYTGTTKHPPRCAGSESTDGDVISNPPTNTWFREQFIVPPSGTLKRVLNRQTLEAATRYVGSLGGKVGLYGCSPASYAVECRTDWIFVRKYVYPEPSHGSWGSEETPPPQTGGPYPPTLSSPADNARFNPGSSVLFTWVFSHWNSSESQSAYQFQLDDSNDFSSPIIDTGKVASSATQTQQTLPNTVGLYYWRVRVWDTQNIPSDYSDPRQIIVDRLEVYGAWVSDSRADVGSTQYCYWQLRYDYDDVVFDSSKGAVKVNGDSASWNSQQGRWEYATTKYSVGLYVYTLTFVDNTYGLTAITGTTELTIIFDGLEVYAFGVSDGRVNVGESVVVWVKIRYAYDGVELDGSKGSVSIGGISASWSSQNSRWEISVSQPNVCHVDYATPSAVTDSQYGLTAISGSTVQRVVWDRVLVSQSGVTDGRVNVGDNSTVYFVLRYEYDNALITDGVVYVNGSAAYYSPQNGRWELVVQQSSVCRKAYYVSAVSGNAYGITAINHQAPCPIVVWDKVLVVSGGITKQRADVGSSVKVYFVLRYAYDDGLVTSGTVQINGTSASYNGTAGRWEALVSLQSVGRFGFAVSSVFDGQYGLTAFSDAAGPQYCIWDRILIYDGGVSDTRHNVGGTVYVWFKARYEYDNVTFDGSKGSLLINGTAASWDVVRWLITYSSNSVGRYAFTVSAVQDGQYGLTAFSLAVDPPCTVFDKVLVTLSVAKTRVNIGAQAQIILDAVYAYDGAPFQGFVRLNDTETAKRTAGRWGFTVLAISDDLYGLTAFESNAVSVVWDGLVVYAQSVDLERGLVAVRVKYAYDGLPVEGARVSYAGLTAYTNASGWAVFNAWNITRVPYGTAAYALSEPLYGLTLCVQSLSVQFAKESADAISVSAKAPISNFVFDVVNRKLSFHTSGTAVCFLDGMGRPQRVEVNRVVWSNWVYRDDGTLIIYGLSSYVVVSWPLPQAPPEQPQQPPQYITMVSLNVRSVDLGVLAPGQTVNFTISVSCNGSASIVGLEFLLKPEWFTLRTKLPITASKGTVDLAVSLAVPSNVQGKFSVPFKLTAAVEGSTISANGLVNFTVREAAEGVEGAILAYLFDPLTIIIVLLTVLVLAAALRRR